MWYSNRGCKALTLLRRNRQGLGSSSSSSAIESATAGGRPARVWPLVFSGRSPSAWVRLARRRSCSYDIVLEDPDPVAGNGGGRVQPLDMVLGAMQPLEHVMGMRQRPAYALPEVVADPGELGQVFVAGVGMGEGEASCMQGGEESAQVRAARAWKQHEV